VDWPPEPAPSTTPVAFASAEALRTPVREIAPLTETLLDPRLASTSGLVPSTRACPSAPAPATRPPESAVAWAHVFAVASAAIVTPPPLVIPA
jgi:hypothetical protein